VLEDGRLHLYPVHEDDAAPGIGIHFHFVIGLDTQPAPALGLIVNWYAFFFKGIKSHNDSFRRRGRSRRLYNFENQKRIREHPAMSRIVDCGHRMPEDNKSTHDCAQQRGEPDTWYGYYSLGEVKESLRYK
jgi:hypothetical protein